MHILGLFLFAIFALVLGWLFIDWQYKRSEKYYNRFRKHKRDSRCLRA